MELPPTAHKALWRRHDGSRFSDQTARPPVETHGDGRRAGNALSRLMPSFPAGAACVVPDLPKPPCTRPSGVNVPRSMAIVDRVIACYRDLNGRLVPAT